MSVLFGRSYKLTLDTIQIEGGGVGSARYGLDIAFKVESNTKHEPNKIDLRVWNLTPDHRASLQKRSGSQVSKLQRAPIPVQLEAGFADDRGVIFRGDLLNFTVDREGPDFIAVLSGSDSGHSYRVARLDRGFVPGTLVYVVMKACVDAMGVGTGNLTDYASSLNIPNLGNTYPEGYIASGPAESVLTKVAKSCGLSWSVQKGVLQLKPINQPIARKVYRLSAQTGLIGTPVPEVDNTVIPSTTGKANPPVAARRTGLIKAQSLLLHQLYPGAIIDLVSDAFTGAYQITQVEYVGESAGNDWQCDLLLRPY